MQKAPLGEHLRTWKTLNLTWAEGDSFTVEDKPGILDDDTIAENILAAIAETPGIAWTKVEKATLGVGAAPRHPRRTLRSRLIINVVQIDGIETALSSCPERRPAHISSQPMTQLSSIMSAAGTQRPVRSKYA